MFYSFKEGMCQIAVHFLFLFRKVSFWHMKCRLFLWFWVSKIHHGNRPCWNVQRFMRCENTRLAVAGRMDWQLPVIIHFRLGFSLLNQPFWGSSITMETNKIQSETTISILCFLCWLQYLYERSRLLHCPDQPADRNWIRVPRSISPGQVIRDNNAWPFNEPVT